jgi:DNA repair ATPase RecN
MFTLRVKNFQSLEDCEVEVQGLTVVTGQNNSGKTALMRSAFGVFTNSKGTKFVRHGKEHCSVTLEFGDGHTVTWEKGEGVNRYIIDGRTLNKVGSGKVPEEVSSLGVQPLQISGRDPLWPQFAQQITGQVFLLDQPGSVLAEAIADVDKVGVLNEALRLSQSDYRSSVSERKIRQEDIAKWEDQEKRFDGLDHLQGQVHQLEILQGVLESQRASVKTVQGFRERIQTLAQSISDLLPVREISVPEDPSRLTKIEAAYQWAISMEEKIKLAEATCRTRREAQEIAKGIKLPEIPDFTALFVRLQELSTLRDNGLTLCSTLKKLREALTLVETEVTQAEQELAKAQAEVKECPTCGSYTLQDGCT